MVGFKDTFMTLFYQNKITIEFKSVIKIRKHKKKTYNSLLEYLKHKSLDE